MAIEIFKTMKSSGCLPDAATYNIMIDCCSAIRGFRSACALVSMMIRDGFNPQAVTYTALIKVLLFTVFAIVESLEHGAIICMCMRRLW